MSGSIEQDAREYRAHVRHGGWRIGLLVARNVGLTPGKVTAEDFAAQSETSTARVLRYLNAWNLAAKAGHVPHADKVVPGQEVQLPLDENSDIWRTYYTSPAGMHVSAPRRERLEEEAKARGTGATTVKNIASNPKAMAAAIVADEDTAKAARAALEEFESRQAAKATAQHLAAKVPQAQPNDDMAELEALNVVRMSVDRVRTALRYLQTDMRGWNQDQRQYAAERLRPYTDVVGMVVQALEGVGDEALADALSKWSAQ